MATTSSSIDRADLFGAGLSSRLRAIEAIIAWSDGSASQQVSARALARDFLSDAASAIDTEAMPSANVARANLRVANEALDKETFDGRQILNALRKVARSCQPPRARWRLLSLPGFQRSAKSVILAGIFLALGYVLAPGLLYPASLTRMADFIRLSNALEHYKADHGSYPISVNADGGNDWTGIGWNGIGENWLPGLTPNYLDKLPRDPRNSQIQHAQYIYFSNGTDYKLLSLNAGECLLIVRLRPWLNDAVRNHGRSCSSYGFQTAGARKW